jgi:chloramphenicol 3-O-phosphotransferase
MIRGIAFVVVRGPALAGKSAVTQRVAELLPGKSAVISQDELWWRDIVRHDDDLAAEAEVVYRQIKLLAASYIRARYHVVVDGAFAVARDGVAAAHDSDLRDLLSLVSTIPDVRPLLVSVTAPLATLLERTRAAGRDERDVEAMCRAIEASAMATPVVLDTSAHPVSQCAEAIIERLEARR